ncbi:MAG: 3-keto-disaccharide hydrolase [Jejuia sp.]
MKKTPFILLSLYLFITNTSCTQKEDTFVDLFNGENLDGWYLKLRNNDTTLAKKVFTVDNEMVHVFKDFPSEYELNKGKNGTHGMMYTNKSYSKFILKFEYKWGKGLANNFDQFQYDAGVFYHVMDDKIWPKGIEYQVRYNHVTNTNHTGDFWSPEMDWYSADGKTFTPKEKGGKLLVKRGEHLALKDFDNYNALNGKWNQCEVIVMADKYVIHKLNGEIVNMATNLPYASGKIGFQSETAEIFYRNIEIREFEESIPISEFIN